MGNGQLAMGSRFRRGSSRSEKGYRHLRFATEPVPVFAGPGSSAFPNPEAYCPLLALSLVEGPSARCLALRASRRLCSLTSEYCGWASTQRSQRLCGLHSDQPPSALICVENARIPAVCSDFRQTPPEGD